MTETLCDLVEKIIEKHPKAAENDYLLYGFYLNSKGISILASFEEITAKTNSGELSSMESVGRAKRKVLAKRRSEWNN